MHLRFTSLFLSFAALFFISVTTASAQAVSTDTLNAHVNALSGQVNKMSKLKLTGYIQSQFQYADSSGVAAPEAGGNFAPGVDKRFLIRRGRIKFTYNGAIAQGVLMFDA